MGHLPTAQGQSPPRRQTTTAQQHPRPHERQTLPRVCRLCVKIGTLRRNKNTPRSIVRGTALGHEARQGVAVATADARDLSLGYALGQERSDEAALGIELVFLRRGATSLRSAEHHALSPPPREGFAGALTDEVALDLGREPESKGQHLALNVVAQPIVVFDRPHAALLGHAEIENLHDHEEIAPQARKFAADDGVAGRHAAQQRAECPLVVGLGAADGFLDPAVDVQRVAADEGIDLEALVLDRLFVAAHADVAVSHK